VKTISPDRPVPWGLLALTGAMLLLILYSGLRFKGAAITNEVSWIDSRTGIRFGNSGVVYGNTPPTTADATAPDQQPLSIEMALKPQAPNDGHFKLLLVLHGHDDDSQLVIGQWKSWLVVMHGDDYAHKRHRPRISVNALQKPVERFLSVTSGQAGTALFLDGTLIRRNADLHLHIPKGNGRTRLVLGNSVYGRHAWAGEIYGLAYFDRELSGEAIKAHYRKWNAERTFAFALKDKAVGLYLFDEGQGTRVADHAPGGNDLQIPRKITILIKEFLAAPPSGEEFNLSLFQDMVINLTGFFPMGFLLSALLWHWRRQTFRKRLLIVMLVCGVISLTIELAQAWIPSRSSQMLDLILNTLGGGIGALLHGLYQRAFIGRDATSQASRS
jgi:VanZ family protein